MYAPVSICSSLSDRQSFGASINDFRFDVGYGIGDFRIPIIWQLIVNIILKDEPHGLASSSSISSKISSVCCLRSSRSDLFHVGFPLKVEPGSISELAKSHGLIQLGGKSYLLVSKSILDSRGDDVGTIIVPKEVTGEEHVIRQHIAFNAIATLVSWLAALVVVIVFLAVEDWRHRPQAVSLEVTLKNGESQSVEFKEGHPDVPLQRAIAAFANTNSGTIFLGVDDDGKVVGGDYDSLKKKDEELLRIRNLTTQVLNERRESWTHEKKAIDPGRRQIHPRLNPLAGE